MAEGRLLPLEVFTMLGIGVFVIFLRSVTRIKSVGVGALKLDDYLMFAAAVSINGPRIVPTFH